ncbi:hypothetical protein ACHAW6_008306 [Cyclotella cf. meneghiniana]
MYKKGMIELIHFFQDHPDQFPKLFIIVQDEASCRAVEVGCKHFFGLSGYISQSCQSRLNVRNYKRFAMLTYLMQHVLIDQKWVADEYLRHCKAGKWKKSQTEDALKCFNYKCIIDAIVFGLEVSEEITYDDYIGTFVEY